jgi:hypothetical protein
MNRTILAAALGALATAATAAAPLDHFKGKVKPGMYETKMEMQIPGMPAGMGKQNMTFKNCVIQKDIDQSQVCKTDVMPKDCEIKNLKSSGNTTSYTMECKGERPMTADNTITFRGDGYTMDMKMAMSQGGQVMNMQQKMDSRYVGPCTK